MHMRRLTPGGGARLLDTRAKVSPLAPAVLRAQELRGKLLEEAEASATANAQVGSDAGLKEAGRKTAATKSACTFCTLPCERLPNLPFYR